MMDASDADEMSSAGVGAADGASAPTASAAPAAGSPGRLTCSSSPRLTIRDVEGKGHVQNLLIKDNTFEDFSPSESVINGLDAEHVFENVTIENLVIAKQRRTTADEAMVKVGQFTRNVTIK